jgi:hypothetical protein
LVPIRRQCPHERGQFLNHPAIRLGQRQSKLHAIASPGIIDGAAPQSPTVQLHVKPLGAIDDEKFRSRSAPNQIRLRVPTNLQLSLPI